MSQVDNKKLRADIAAKDNCIAELKEALDIGSLGAEILELRAELAMATDAANKGDRARHEIQAVIDERDQLRAEVEQLNKELSWYHHQRDALLMNEEVDDEH